MINHKIEFDHLDWEYPIDGVRCKVLRLKGKQVRLVEYSQSMPLHWCEKGHFGIILEGEFEIEFNDRKEIFKPGNGVFIPDGEEHRHKAKSLSKYVKVLFVEDL